MQTSTIHIYTVGNRNGKRLVVNDSFSRVEELAQAIEENTFPSLFEQADQGYNACGSLTFGPVMVNKSGIHFGKKHYAWDEVQQISIQEGVLKVSKKGGGLFSGRRVAVAAIPNLRVLLNIITQVVGIQTEK